MCILILVKNKNMKIIITGGCGFIGSNFIRKQINETENIIANIDSLTYAGNIQNLSKFGPESIQNLSKKKKTAFSFERIKTAIPLKAFQLWPGL